MDLSLACLRSFSTVPGSIPARHSLRLVAELQSELGFGPQHRPGSDYAIVGSFGICQRCRRGDGPGQRGTRAGRVPHAWTDWRGTCPSMAVWESWVAAFVADLAPRVGLVPTAYQAARRYLHWTGIQSMSRSLPDVELRGSTALFSSTLSTSRICTCSRARAGSGLTADVQSQHRADLHQALADALLSDVLWVTRSCSP